MNLSDPSIDRFREIWKQTYGKELPEEDSREYATDLLKLGEVIYRNRLITKNRKPP